MPIPNLVQKLFDESQISESSYEKLKHSYSNNLFSLNFELKTLLFAGVMLLTAGLGVVIYQNIDSIGHIAIILFIAAVSVSCLAWCYKKRVPYSNGKTESPSIFFEFVLLLGCLTFASFNGYLQYQYSIYGPANGASFLLPAILFFAAAYFFDHIGVLSLAITSFAAFIGITIAPTSLLSDNDFSSEQLVVTGLLYGAALLFAAVYLSRRQIKKHFTFTYYNFALHMMFICCLSGLFSFDQIFIFLPVLCLMVYLFGTYAMKAKSFYFLLFAVIYGYIGLTYSIFYYLFKIWEAEIILFYFSLLYLILSSVYIIRFLKTSRNEIKKGII